MKADCCGTSIYEALLFVIPRRDRGIQSFQYVSAGSSLQLEPNVLIPQSRNAIDKDSKGTHLKILLSDLYSKTSLQTIGETTEKQSIVIG